MEVWLGLALNRLLKPSPLNRFVISLKTGEKGEKGKKKEKKKMN